MVRLERAHWEIDMLKTMQRPRHRRSAGLLGAAVGLLALVVSACAPTPAPATGTSPNEAPRAGDAAYVEPGPYDVGVRTIQLADREVEVWYPATGAAGQPKDEYFIRDELPAWLNDLIPADVNPPFVTDAVRDLPLAQDGPYPLVLFSHGFASYRTQSTFLTTHLASWGFVVVSPDYFERGLRGILGEPPASPRADEAVAAEAIDTIRDLSATPGGPLADSVIDDLVLPVGHSAGGSTSLRLLSRDDVPSAIALAMGMNLTSFGQLSPLLAGGKPISWIGAQNDSVIGIGDVRTGYDYSAGERRLVELSGSGHVNAFSDICEIGDGGAAGIARAIGLPLPDSLLALGDDGCDEARFQPSEQVWPEVRHFVTAELRLRAGLDDEPVGLGDAVVPQFDDVAVYRHDP